MRKTLYTLELHKNQNENFTAIFSVPTRTFDFQCNNPETKRILSYCKIHSDDLDYYLRSSILEGFYVIVKINTLIRLSFRFFFHSPYVHCRDQNILHHFHVSEDIFAHNKTKVM